MPFNLKSFAEQVRPSNRPSAPAFANSVFDAGSPQYVRPEDLFLDIQAQLFKVKRYKAQDLNRVEPSDFKTRWLNDGIGTLSLQRVGTVKNEQLGDALMSLLRCSQRKKERFPTLLPIVPAVGFFKNIKYNLPNSLNDQLRPALSFADDVGFAQRVATLKKRLAEGTQPNDSLKQLATALLPIPSGSAIDPTAADLPIHDGPLLKDYSSNPVRTLPVCQGLKEVVDTLIAFEGSLPRILWTRWLTETLRIWLPLFFLKRCTVTTNAAHAAKTVLTTKSVLSPAELGAKLLGTNGILRGSKEWLNQLAPIIQDYVRARLELSILLELCNLYERLMAQGFDPRNPSQANQIDHELATYEVKPGNQHNVPLPQPAGICDRGKLAMPGDPDARWLSFDKWLDWIKDHIDALDSLSQRIGAQDTKDLIERVYAFIRPTPSP